MPPTSLDAWFAALTARLERHDHAGAMTFLVERSAELLAVPGGPSALVAFLAEARARADAIDPWSYVLAADLESLVDAGVGSPLAHALAVFAGLELDRAVETGACAICEAASAPDDPLARLARGGHHVAAGRFADALAELEPLCDDAALEPPLLRVVAGLLAARVVLRSGDPIEGRRRLEILAAAVPPDAGLAALVEVHLLRALLSAAVELEAVRARAAALRDGEGPAIVRELARRLHAFAVVLLGEAPSPPAFEAGTEAHLDAAEVSALAGVRTSLAPLLAIAAACERDGRRYLEARARIAAATAAFGQASAPARRRATLEIARARRLCEDHGYRHLAARCDLLLAIVADRSREASDHELSLETVLERSTTTTMLERLAEAVLHRRPLAQLEIADTRFLDLLGHCRLPAFSVDDGSGARLVGGLDLERWRGRADLVVDLDRSELVARGRVVRGQARLVALLAHLISSGARPVEADELFRGVWSARSYSPLRHRNAVYLAISRTRRVLAPLLGDAPIERHPNGWRLREDLYAVVVRAVPAAEAPPLTATAPS